MAKYIVSIEFESNKERPYLAALELSEAIANGQCTFYKVTEIETDKSIGVYLDEPEFLDSNETMPNLDAIRQLQ